jgi:hypothetical protein
LVRETATRNQTPTGEFAVTGKPRWLKTVPVARADLVSLSMLANPFYRDRAPARVRVGLGVVA